MEILKELEKLSETLKTQRDEIKVKLHLASMEAKEEWDKFEDKWDEFKIKAADIADDTKETTDDLVASTKVIGEELQSAYNRIVDRLKS